jgi:sugar lactone lactonase YvrE
MINRSSQRPEQTPTPVDWTSVAATGSNIGEGPVYVPATGEIFFVDISGQLIHRHVDGERLKSFRTPSAVTAIVPRRRGGMVVTLERAIATFDPNTGGCSELWDLPHEPTGNRFNDAKCDRLGRLWAGTMGKTQWAAPVGTLYKFDGESPPEPMIQNVRCSNGLGWSPDNSIFYFCESFAHTIWEFDYDSGNATLHNRRPFVRLDQTSGAFPDGLTVDSEGFVWSAQPFYGRLVRYSPSGAVDRIVDAPVSRPTSCAFGGALLDTLFVTSAKDSLTPVQLDQEPLAGNLLSFRPGVAGITEVPFSG